MANINNIPKPRKLTGRNSHLDNKAMCRMEKLAQAGDRDRLWAFDAVNGYERGGLEDFRYAPAVIKYKMKLLESLNALEITKLPRNKAVSVGDDKFWAEFSLIDLPPITGPSIPMPNCKQYDIHSCAFVAALTVSSYLSPNVTPLDVLRAVQPNEEWGLDRAGVIAAFRKLGIKAKHKGDLTIKKLRQYVEQKIPVVITVWPEDWSSNHWCVVRGFSKDGKTIYLSNYGKESVQIFDETDDYWYGHGGGLICTKDDKPKISKKPVIIEHGKFWAKVSLKDPPAITGPSIPLPNYKQIDDHSCSFVSVLTVASYLNPNITPMDVLKAVQPNEQWGQDSKGVRAAFRKLGITAKQEWNLTVKKLIEQVEQMVPVVVSVKPKGWEYDHWCVVRGFSKDGNTIYLSNHVKLSVEDFIKRIPHTNHHYWFEPGDGLVCTKK